jgi:hypothetical protein
MVVPCEMARLANARISAPATICSCPLSCAKWRAAAGCGSCEEVNVELVASGGAGRHAMAASNRLACLPGVQRTVSQQPADLAELAVAHRGNQWRCVAASSGCLFLSFKCLHFQQDPC